MPTLYKVGIRFSPLGDYMTTEEAKIYQKHWSLVFTPKYSPTTSRVVEVTEGQEGKVEMIVTDFGIELPAHPLMEYMGELSDADSILEAHPMRESNYSACFNNCQHFSVIFLIFLQAFADASSDKSFQITHSERMETILPVLSKDGRKLYNSPNWYLQNARLAPVSIASAAMMACAAAAEATVATTVPAAGIMGWLGATTTVFAPAAYAAFASSMVPITAAAALASGGAYLWKSHSWMERTMFQDPRQVGFPEGYKKPLRLVGPAIKMGNKGWKSAISTLKITSVAYAGSEIGAASALASPGMAAVSAPMVAITTLGALIRTRHLL